MSNADKACFKAKAVCMPCYILCIFWFCKEYFHEQMSLAKRSLLFKRRFTAPRHSTLLLGKKRGPLHSIHIWCCFSRYDITNLNRQLGSDNAVGRSKVDTIAALYPGVRALHEKVDEEWVENFDFDQFDLVLDAIDDVTAKVMQGVIFMNKRCCFVKLSAFHSSSMVSTSRS